MSRKNSRRSAVHDPAGYKEDVENEKDLGKTILIILLLVVGLAIFSKGCS